jgi:hypothetical protein
LNDWPLVLPAAVEPGAMMPEGFRPLRVARLVPLIAHVTSKRIGMAGFEPAVSWSQARRIAGLPHIPG